MKQHFRWILKHSLKLTRQKKDLENIPERRTTAYEGVETQLSLCDCHSQKTKVKGLGVLGDEAIDKVRADLQES